MEKNSRCPFQAKSKKAFFFSGLWVPDIVQRKKIHGASRLQRKTIKASETPPPPPLWDPGLCLRFPLIPYYRTILSHLIFATTRTCQAGFYLARGFKGCKLLPQQVQKSRKTDRCAGAHRLDSGRDSDFWRCPMLVTLCTLYLSHQKQTNAPFTPTINPLIPKPPLQDFTALKNCSSLNHANIALTISCTIH